MTDIYSLAREDQVHRDAVASSQSCVMEDTPSLPAAIGAFLADCQARSLASRTMTIYAHQLAAFQTWMQVPSIQEITPRHVRGYMLHLQAQGHNAGGQHQAFRVLRTFFRWAVVEGWLQENPMQRLRPPRLREEPLAPVPLDHVSAMVETCRSEDLLDLRDKALLLTLLDTGARAGEILAARVRDMDLDARQLLLRVTKNRRQRLTFIGMRTRDALQRYLLARTAAPEEPLFATERGYCLSYAGLRQILRRRARSAGVRAPGAHAFRRAACLALLRDGADVFTVQALAGHADLSTTRRYVRLVAEDLRLQHAQHSPVDRALHT